MTATTPERTTTAIPGRRRWVWIVLGILAVLALAAGAIYFWLLAGSGVQSRGQPQCESVAVTAAGSSQPTAAQAQEGICATMTDLAQTWAVHDADGYSAAFTEGATYTTWVGTHYTGRSDIAEGHRALFAGPLEGTRLADSFLGIELISDDVAVVTTRGDTYEGEAPDELTKVQTYTMVRQPDRSWLIASFHNTQRSPLIERIQFLMVPDSRPFAER